MTTATATRERPILLGDRLVRATLDGTKTQTRRPVTRRQFDEGWVTVSPGANYTPALVADLFPSPFGGPGDRLWVREAFAIESCFEVGWYPPPFFDGRPLRSDGNADGEAWWEQCHYRATDPMPSLACDHRRCADENMGECLRPWRPSIHMPRWASRITLEITDVRAERVQDISEDDVLAEGVRVPVSESGTPLLRLTGKPAPCEYAPLNHRDTIATATAADWLRAHFACAWDEHYAGGPYAWAENPWVRAISYRRVEP